MNEILISLGGNSFSNVKFPFEGTPEEAIEEGKRLYALSLGGSGLPDKEFDTFVEKQLLGESNHIEQLEKLSPEQNKTVQIIKRAIKRITYKQNKQ